MGKTAASGAKTSGPTSATVVLAGALGCFAAGYGAHSLGSATKTIQKAVQSRVPAAIKNLLPRFSTASPKLKGELAHQVVKPAQNAPSMHAAVVAETTEAVVSVKPEQPLKEPNKLLGNDEQEEKRAATNESKLATATREGLPEAEISFACSGKPTVCPSSDAKASLGTASTTSTAID
eukprot:COSAG02_NODE_214_length_28689_cov_34.895523_11_plen_178_part_00